MEDDLMVEIPDEEELDEGKIDKETLAEAMAALKQVRAAKARAKDRRENMTEEEKLAAAEAAKERRAKIALQVKYAEDNGYLPSKDEIKAYLAAQSK